MWGTVQPRLLAASGHPPALCTQCQSPGHGSAQISTWIKASTKYFLTPHKPATLTELQPLGDEGAGVSPR